jgi:aldose 1-epimerase
LQVRDNKTVATANRETFGMLPDGTSVDLISLAGAGGLKMSAMTYGCTIVSLSAPDRDFRDANVILGFDRLDGYLGDSRYYGAVAGRYANRIANARFLLDGRTYDVSANEPPNHLHGGYRGFDKRVWDAEIHEGGRGVVFRRVSPHGEEGYPGTLVVSITYLLTDSNELHVQYDAEADAPTHVNLTQHSYFNLRGDGRGDVLDHRLQVSADSYLPVNAQMIPTGEIAPVANTPFDFREPAAIGSRAGGAYDHNFILATGAGVPARAARVSEPSTGRTMEVRTTEPGLQLYSGGDHRGLCLETQHYPDSPNRPEFPSTILRPGQRYQSRTEFAFGIG